MGANRFKVVLFELADSLQAAIDLNYVEKVIPLVKIEPVPNCPDYLVGMINTPEESIPIIDLSMMVGLKRKNSYTLETSIIILLVGKKKYGFVVDRLVGVAEVVLESQKMLGKHCESQYFKNTVTHKRNVYLLFDMESFSELGAAKTKTTQGTIK